MAAFLSKWLSKLRPESAHEPDWARYRPAVEKIRALRNELRSLHETEVRQYVSTIRANPNVPECFAAACEALRRTIGLDLFDVQVIGALAMNDGAIAEMQTGEGKTLAAVLTVFVNAWPDWALMFGRRTIILPGATRRGWGRPTSFSD